jgi:hypothetical protein
MWHSRHGDEGMQGSGDSNTENAPVADFFLWSHAFVMSASFTLFAFGIVVGMKRNAGLHVALQAIAIGLLPLGLVLPRFHKSYHLPPNIPHRWMGWIIVILIACQTAMGILRKQSWTRSAHSVLGPMFLLLFPAQIELGVIAITETCYQRGYHTGQCVAHYVMGTAFIYYAFFIIIRRFGLLKSFQREQSFYDSVIIFSWGVVNSLTEHPWGSAWSHGDVQHTSMGVLWLTGGLLSILMQYSSTVNFVPSIVFGVTGIAMSLHHQIRPISTSMHAFFGVTLLIASTSKAMGLFLKTGKLDLFTAFWMMAAGFFFMGSNEEALAYLEDKAMFDASSWMMLLVSATFLCFSFGLLLIFIYTSKDAAPAIEEDLGTPLTMRDDTLRDYAEVATQEEESSLVK